MEAGPALTEGLSCVAALWSDWQHHLLLLFHILQCSSKLFFPVDYQRQKLPFQVGFAPLPFPSISISYGNYLDFLFLSPLACLSIQEALGTLMAGENSSWCVPCRKCCDLQLAHLSALFDLLLAGWRAQTQLQCPAFSPAKSKGMEGCECSGWKKGGITTNL